jgi:hypothetical protein
MRKFFVLCVLLLSSLSVMAEDSDINLTPRNTFSGYSNNTMKTEYPHLNSVNTQYNTVLEQQRKQWMKPTSVRSMGNITPKNDGNGTMTFNQFPQTYDSSDMMHVQQIQQGVQNMYMGL